MQLRLNEKLGKVRVYPAILGCLAAIGAYSAGQIKNTKIGLNALADYNHAANAATVAYNSISSAALSLVIAGSIGATVSWFGENATSRRRALQVGVVAGFVASILAHGAYETSFGQELLADALQHEATPPVVDGLLGEPSKADPYGDLPAGIVTGVGATAATILASRRAKSEDQPMMGLAVVHQPAITN